MAVDIYADSTRRSDMYYKQIQVRYNVPHVGGRPVDKAPVTFGDRHRNCQPAGRDKHGPIFECRREQ